MSGKLTLSIEKEIIENAKNYAKSQGRSLSNIISEYLKSLHKNTSKFDAFKKDGTIENLFGSVKYSGKKSYKEILNDALADKYL